MWKCGWYMVQASMFILGSFVFSVIFWVTKKWVDQLDKKKK
jgi:hypothetical protein